MMKRILICLVLLAAGRMSFAQENSAETREQQIQAMEQRLPTMTDPVVKLYFKATIERAKGDPESAIRTLSELIVHFPRNETWIARAELMSAELYIELAMPDAAETAVRQIQLLYEGSETAEQAAALRPAIEKLREQTKSEEGNES